MKRIVFILFALTCLQTSFAETVKIGYVNVNFLVESSPQLAVIQKTIREEFRPQEERFNTLAERFSEQQKAFEEGRDSMSQEEVASELELLATERQALAERAQTMQREIEIRNNDEFGKLESQINEVIQEFAEAEGYDLILYQDVAFAKEEINITKIISERLRSLAQ